MNKSKSLYVHALLVFVIYQVYVISTVRNTGNFYMYFTLN